MHSNYHYLRCFLIFPFLLHSVLALPLFPDDKPHCSPTSWQDVFIFFLTNYIAHAATVPAPPGAGSLGNFQWAFLSLLHPIAGLGRAAIIIFHHCAFGKDEIGRALSAGALAVVARTQTWRPPTDSKCGEELVCFCWPNQFMQDVDTLRQESDGGDEIATATVIVGKAPESLLPHAYVKDNFDAAHSLDVNSGYNIHGNHILPDGYYWVTPSPVNTSDLVKGLKDRSETQVAESPSLLKMAISVIQLALSCITLYRTRGNQLHRYGYAAFGLSAFPYAFMSLINLICIGCMGDYPYLFMLQTPTMQEAKGRRGAVIGGEVGILQTAHRPQNNRRQSSHASGLDEDEMELRPLMVDGVAGSDKKDESVTAWLWADDSAGLLWARVGNPKPRRFQLVAPDQNPTFVFRVHPFHNWLHIYKSGLESKGYQRTSLAKTSSRQCLLERFQPAFTETKFKIWKLPIGLAFKAAIAITSPFLGLVLPYLFLYGLTRFQPRKSTYSQRNAMISWIVMAQYVMILETYFIIRQPNFSLSYSVIARSVQAKIRSILEAWKLFRARGVSGFLPNVRSWARLWGLQVLKYFGWILFWGMNIWAYVGTPVTGFLAVERMLEEFGSCSLS